MRFLKFHYRLFACIYSEFWLVNKTIAFALIGWLKSSKLSHKIFLDSIHEAYFLRVVYHVSLKSFSHHVLWRIFRPFQRWPNWAFFIARSEDLPYPPHEVLWCSGDSAHIGSWLAVDWQSMFYNPPSYYVGDGWSSPFPLKITWSPTKASNPPPPRPQASNNDFSLN